RLELLGGLLLRRREPLPSLDPARAARAEGRRHCVSSRRPRPPSGVRRCSSRRVLAVCTSGTRLTEEHDAGHQSRAKTCHFQRAHRYAQYGRQPDRSRAHGDLTRSDVMAVIAKSTRATIIPCLRYRDAAAAIAWLCNAFGFEQQAVYANDDGTIAHAQLTFGN